MRQALREHTLTVDVANGRVVVSPPPTYDITDPHDDIPTPAWWKSRVVVDGSVVRLKTVAAHAVFTCNSGGDNYTLGGATQGVSDVIDVTWDGSHDNTRIRQRLIFTDTLPSTNGRDFVVELVSYTGDPRSVSIALSGIVAPFGATYIEFDFRVGGVSVAPVVGATYTVNVLFWQTS